LGLLGEDVCRAAERVFVRNPATSMMSHIIRKNEIIIASEILMRVDRLPCSQKKMAKQPFSCFWMMVLNLFSVTQNLGYVMLSNNLWLLLKHFLHFSTLKNLADFSKRSQDVAVELTAKILVFIPPLTTPSHTLNYKEITQVSKAN